MEQEQRENEIMREREREREEKGRKREGEEREKGRQGMGERICRNNEEFAKKSTLCSLFTMVVSAPSAKRRQIIRTFTSII